MDCHCNNTYREGEDGLRTDSNKRTFKGQGKKEKEKGNKDRRKKSQEKPIYYSRQKPRGQIIY